MKLSEFISALPSQEINLYKIYNKGQRDRISRTPSYIYNSLDEVVAYNLGYGNFSGSSKDVYKEVLEALKRYEIK